MSKFHPWFDPAFYYADKGGRRSFGGLLDALREGTLLVPHYQRGRVWTQDQQARWVGYVLSGAPLPAIFIREVNAVGGFRDEILDGQQRLTALLDWTAGKVDAVTWDGQIAACKTDQDRRMVERCACACVTMPVTTSDTEAMRLYLRLNTAGTPHTAEELDRVRALLLAGGKRTAKS